MAGGWWLVAGGWAVATRGGRWLVAGGRITKTYKALVFLPAVVLKVGFMTVTQSISGFFP